MPNSVIQTNKRANPDGFGIAWREPKTGLQFRKFGPDKFAEFERLLKRIDKRKSVEYVAHFRTKTHGPACERLSHPFTYEDEAEGTTLVFHNGIISIKTDETESDTSTFTATVLRRLPSAWWNNGALAWLVEESIGASRMVIMTATETIRLNESLGEWHSGIWYSTTPEPSWAKNYGQTRAVTAYASDAYDENGWPKYGITGTPSAGTIEYHTSHEAKSCMAPTYHAAVMQVVADRLAANRIAADHATSLVTASAGVMVAEPEVRTTDIRDWADPDLMAAHVSGAWTHRGHVVEPLDEVNYEADEIAGSVRCMACATEGEYFLLQGTIYIDLEHLLRDEGEDDLDEGAA